MSPNAATPQGNDPGAASFPGKGEGRRLPDWPELRERLSRSRFRSRFDLSDADRAYVALRGWGELAVQAEKILRERLAPAEPRNDGRQTPMRGHPVFLAQHATGACCRGCLAKWHGVPAGRELTDAEVAHVVSCLLAWIREKAGDLSGFPVQPTLFQLDRIGNPRC